MAFIKAIKTPYKPFVNQILQLPHLQQYYYFVKNHHCSFGHLYCHNTTENLPAPPKAKIHSQVEDSLPISLAKQTGECSISQRVNYFHRQLSEM